METPIDLRFRLCGGLLRHQFRGHNLKCKRDGGEQDEERIDDRGMAETFRAEKPANDNVVGQAEDGRKARAAQQHHGSLDNSRL